MPLGQATVAGFLSNNTWYVLAKPAAAAVMQGSLGKCLVSACGWVGGSSSCCRLVCS
jgi:hypothetical protein